MLFVMLNPSTADGSEDDPTIRRCRGFALREHATRFDVVNLFSYRATDPRDLAIADPSFDLVGPDNDNTIRRLASEVDQIVVAWGAWGDRFGARVAQVVTLLEGSDLAAQAGGGARPLYCLGTTNSGQPCHPLMLAKSVELIPWGLT
jgi:hypothetical protein